MFFLLFILYEKPWMAHILHAHEKASCPLKLMHIVIIQVYTCACAVDMICQGPILPIAIPFPPWSIPTLGTFLMPHMWECLETLRFHLCLKIFDKKRVSGFPLWNMNMISDNSQDRPSVYCLWNKWRVRSNTMDTLCEQCLTRKVRRIVLQHTRGREQRHGMSKSIPSLGTWSMLCKLQWIKGLNSETRLE